jgi:hypothetical protein
MWSVTVWCMLSLESVISFWSVCKFAVPAEVLAGGVYRTVVGLVLVLPVPGCMASVGVLAAPDVWQLQQHMQQLP